MLNLSLLSEDVASHSVTGESFGVKVSAKVKKYAYLAPTSQAKVQQDLISNLFYFWVAKARARYPAARNTSLLPVRLPASSLLSALAVPLAYCQQWPFSGSA